MTFIVQMEDLVLDGARGNPSCGSRRENKVYGHRGIDKWAGGLWQRTCGSSLTALPTQKERRSLLRVKVEEETLKV